jgi:transposase
MPDPWRRNVDVSLRLIDDLELQIARLTVQLKRRGADHRYVPLLVTAPGLGWINAYTIASEIGDIGRFASPAKLCGYTGLCPRVKQSGASDRRGPISKHGPKYLRWALFEAALKRANTRTTPSATSTPSAGWAANAAPRSPRSTSPESSPRRSGTCSPTTSPSLRQVPLFV